MKINTPISLNNTRQNFIHHALQVNVSHQTSFWTITTKWGLLVSLERATCAAEPPPRCTVEILHQASICGIYWKQPRGWTERAVSLRQGAHTVWVGGGFLESPKRNLWNSYNLFSFRPLGAEICSVSAGQVASAWLFWIPPRVEMHVVSRHDFWHI